MDIEAREGELREVFTAPQRELMEKRWKLHGADKTSSFHNWVVGFLASNKILFENDNALLAYDLARDDLNQEATNRG